MKKPDFVNLNEWNSIPTDDREHVIILAGRLLKHGFLHQEAFSIATEIQEAKTIISQMGRDFQKLYTKWMRLGISMDGDEITRSRLLGNILRTIRDTSYELSNDFPEQEDAARAAWKKIKWNFPNDHCVCCFSPIIKNNDFVHKSGFNLHPTCEDKFSAFAESLAELLLAQIVEHTMGPKPDKTIVEEVPTPSIIYEDVTTPQFLDIFEN